MKQSEFEERGEERWRAFETDLRSVDKLRSDRLRPVRIPPAMRDLPARYRVICRDLAIAKGRSYSPKLLDRLNTLALDGHRILYRRQMDPLARTVEFVGRQFPQRVRRDAGAVALATLAFLGPGALIFALVLYFPELVYSVFSYEQLVLMESMYDPAAEHLGRDREASGDVQMFGHYIRNNIGIAFQVFAWGIFLGLGSALILAINGLILGALAAHFLHIGYGETFFPFVIGHGSLELTAIVLSGAAGMRLGYALLAPGPRPRAEALRVVALEALQIILGAGLMLVLAAVVEAFWSSKASLGNPIRYGVGAALWAVVFAYFLFVGRARSGSTEGTHGA